MRKVFSETCRVVGAAVVDKDDFGVCIWELSREFSEYGRQRTGFVEHRDDDASLGPHPYECMAKGLEHKDERCSPCLRASARNGSDQNDVMNESESGNIADGKRSRDVL